MATGAAAETVAESVGRGPPQTVLVGWLVGRLRGGGSAVVSWAALLFQLPSSKEVWVGCPRAEKYTAHRKGLRRACRSSGRVPGG